MCSHPHELVIHIIHLCPLHTRSPSPGKHYQLVEFVKFLKKNPRAFEWPGADLSLTSGGVLRAAEVRLRVRPRTSIAEPSYPMGLLVVRCQWELTPHPCLWQGQHPDRTGFPVRMLPSSSIGGCPSPGRGGKIPISPTSICSFSDLVGTYWLDRTCT